MSREPEVDKVIRQIADKCIIQTSDEVWFDELKCRAIIRPLFIKPVPLPPPKEYYKCFGCKQVFVDDKSAEKHFGKPKAREYPICYEAAPDSQPAKEKP